MEIRTVDGLRVLHLGDGLNAFDGSFVSDLDRALQEVEADAEATTLVTTASGKHFSNGYDLEYLGGLEPADLKTFIDASSTALGRLLAFPIPTVAALNGHAFGVGALLALAHDQRVQSSERGWFCLPEIDLQMRFNPFQLAVVVGKLSRPTANEAVLAGRRYDGAAALAAGIADAIAPPDELVARAAEISAARVGKERSITKTLKGDLYAAILEKLE
jgi:enoyl-CoA hydratase/carnithine racemase